MRPSPGGAVDTSEPGRLVQWDVYDCIGEDRFRVLVFLTIGQVVTQRVAADQYDDLRRLRTTLWEADSVIRLATDGLTDAG